ncbi:MAG: HAD family hydrolase [Olsenella sp.]|jgi:phosphoglycolate phosphatase|nr:HAD family hydrolase [Olsenella sp.]MCI1645912.1 HAD family hydrolase [Olsenella sp.]MCI1794117.1 HAD family hydrolase [Olsenella sp.]MCI1810710.1 HAD family hydrolase [Olsenella sp.]MCI1879450.1 HAD family hydrolase [Olsenella sp.]
MPYQTAIFDLDGTLLNTLDDLYNAVNHSLTAFGLPKRSLAEVRLFTGNGIRRLIDLSVPKGTPQDLAGQVFDEFKAFYDAHKLDTTRPYTGMAEVIDDLRAAGIACAVVSNKADFAVQGIIDHFYPGKFDYVMGERAGIQRKPNRDMIDVILRDLGKSANGMVYVGDSEVDVETAKNCGCPCLSCSWGFRDREWLVEHGATTIVDTPAELEASILA